MDMIPLRDCDEGVYMALDSLSGMRLPLNNYLVGHVFFIMTNECNCVRIYRAYGTKTYNLVWCIKILV